MAIIVSLASNLRDSVSNMCGRYFNLTRPSTDNRCLLPASLPHFQLVQFLYSLSFALLLHDINCTRCDDNRKIFGCRYFGMKAKQNSLLSTSYVILYIVYIVQTSLWQIKPKCNHFQLVYIIIISNTLRTIWTDLYLANCMHQLNAFKEISRNLQTIYLYSFDDLKSLEEKRYERSKFEQKWKENIEPDSLREH